MEQTNILLLNLDAGCDLVFSLERILENAWPSEFRVSKQLLQDAEADACSFDESKPDLALLCFSGGALERVRSFMVALRERLNGTPIVLVMESGEFESLWELLKLGAADFLLSPLRATDLLPRLLRLLRHTLTSGSPVCQLKEKLGLKQFIGESEILLQEITKIPKVARCDASVLIGGETGTGKEMVARAIHYLSPRTGKPFIPVNCGAIPIELVENELFGHEAGAFTGAAAASPGLVHDADGGTLFLDEIDSLPPQSQVKLLRFLQDKEYRPLGSRRTCKADVRVIAASNACFEDTIRSGKFRSDLFYRLNVISLLLPPLRKRSEDIPLLAQHLLAKYSLQYKVPGKSLSAAALRKLINYEWPGNIRELENVIAGAIILSEQPTIGSEQICLPVSTSTAEAVSFKALKAKAIAEFETSYIHRLLAANDGNITRAAKAAKKNRRAFWQLMRKHKIRFAHPFSFPTRPGQIHP